ncbi:MAG: PilZ domain-containing protein [Thermodesulfobacteriota bacterium]
MAEHSILISATVHDLLDIDDSFAAREGFNLLIAQDTTDLLITARAQKPSTIFITPTDSENQSAEKSCCHLLKEDPEMKDIPVIAVIDGNNESHLNRCQTRKPDDILFTPLSKHLFLATARRVLGLPHRSFDRVQTSLKVDFGPDRSSFRPACAYNLSTGGIFIATESQIPLNTKLLVKLDLPDSDKPILCESVVSWINRSNDPDQPDVPPGIGLQFLSLNATDLFAIHSFINQRRDSA